MYEFMKRMLDIVGATAGLILALPAMATIAILIRAGSRGPAIFRQERAGRHGRPFILYKFRTMRTDVDPFGPSPKEGADPRLTGIGRLLREHSLDELPQLFNVLKGNMSLVGPRPLYVAQMAEWNDEQKRRLEVKPGLTGLAQISGRGGLTREDKLALDVQYVHTRSLARDLAILLRTVGRVFQKQDIYEKQYSNDEWTRDRQREEAP